MSKTFPWFRLYSRDFLNDDKLDLVADETGEDLATVRGIFVALMCMANDSPTRDGSLMITKGLPRPPAKIYREIGLDEERAEAILAAMENAQLKILDRSHPDEGWCLINFQDRQTRSDTTGAKRQAKWRDKQKEDGQDPGRSPNPVKGKKGTTGQGPDHPYSTPADPIVQYFTDQTGFWPPADPTLSKVYWEDPVHEWLMWANQDQELVEDWINQAIQYNRDNRLAYTRPHSLRSTIDRIATQYDFKRLWQEVTRLIGEHGANKEPADLDPTLAQMIEAAGGWRFLCQLNSNVAREKFAQAFGRVKSHDRRNT